jgi:two-component system OmpR family sensor kinase
MSLRPRRARSRIALAGGLLCAAYLTGLAFVAHHVARRLALENLDEQLETLAHAIVSDFEVEGLTLAHEEALAAQTHGNLLEFRLLQHSAILFEGERVYARTEDLFTPAVPLSLELFRGHGNRPFTLEEPFSGRRRPSRFFVLPVGGQARGATLVLFRDLGPLKAYLVRLDGMLAVLVAVGFLGMATILTFAVRQALRPVEQITALAREVEATDLSRRIPETRGGEEFRLLGSVLNSLLERLERSFRVQNRLFADAAHELKTPAAVLVGEAQEALRGDQTEVRRRRSLETVVSTAKSMARQLDAMLMLARGDAAPPRPRQRVDLGDIAESAILRVDSMAARQRVEISLVRSAEAPVAGDVPGLESLVLNLLSNAVLYTEPGTDVEIRCGGRDGTSFVEVLDRGPGIAEGERSRILGRFVRLDDARRRNPEGSGLGLAIADQVVGSHGGRLEIEARPGGGAIFRASFPRVS